METKLFTKNDNSFICEHCGKEVQPLKYTSRNHCPYCIRSIHVDDIPGDRANECQGIMNPIDVEYTQNKGFVITFKCSKCGEVKKNKMATDDDYDEILNIASHRLQ